MSWEGLALRTSQYPKPRIASGTIRTNPSSRNAKLVAKENCRMLFQDGNGATQVPGAGGVYVRL